METAKRILTKEKIDRQLAGQSSSNPFMSMKGGYASKKVTFDTQDGLEEKIDKFMTMMTKLTTQDDWQDKQFKPKIYQGKRREQTWNFYDRHIYDQKNDQNKLSSDCRDRRIAFSGRTKCRQNYRARPRYEKNYRNDFRRRDFRENMRTNKNYRGQKYRGGYRGNYRNENYDRGRSRSREKQYQDNDEGNERSSSSRSRSGSRATTNGDRIRCCKCREYGHFAKDCPASKLEKEAEQMQKMFNMDEEQTSLKTLATDTYDSLNQVSSMKEISTEHLNLQKVRMVPLHFCL